MNLLLNETDAINFSKLTGEILPEPRIALDFINGGKVKRYDFGEIQKDFDADWGDDWEGGCQDVYDQIPFFFQWGNNVIFTAFLDYNNFDVNQLKLTTP